jgi:ethanolamine-phosphate cytidylyltransferase
MPFGVPDAIYHGPTTFIPLTYDPYNAPKKMGIFRETESHAFQHVNAGEIVGRILKSREAYEERQRAKLQKGAIEDLAKAKEETA